MKKKGFTLVELLAIVVILGILALITTPMILGVIDSSRKNAFEETVKGLIRAVDIDNDRQEYKPTKYKVISGSLYDDKNYKIETNGGSNENGELATNINGEIAAAVNNGRWCAIKKYDSNKLEVTDYRFDACKIQVKKYTEVIDLSNKHNNGKINGPVEFSSGEAIFNGKDTYIDAGYANYNFINGITVVSRFKINGTSSGTQAILGNWQTAGGGIAVNSNLKTFFNVYSDKNKKYYSASYDSVIELGKYYTFVGVFDNKNVKLYLNGNLIKTTALEEYVKVSTFPFYIGANANIGGPAEMANATITDSILYSSAISSEEIKNKYSNKIALQNDDRILFQYKYEDKYLIAE